MKNATKEDTSKEGLKVYASVYPMYDFAKKIAGDKLDVKMVMPQGMNLMDGNRILMQLKILRMQICLFTMVQVLNLGQTKLLILYQTKI
ncbi:hypothetical protein [Peptoniphilus porci]|uniref:hypothetical protein n=1 Tax=Peptoniphilus porci TaxID=2652280 RepID=UPI001F356A4D|nr:hypothetical protein [Peptoniphilus porci]